MIFGNLDVLLEAPLITPPNKQKAIKQKVIMVNRVTNKPTTPLSPQYLSSSNKPVIVNKTNNLSLNKQQNGKPTTNMKIGSLPSVINNDKQQQTQQSQGGSNLMNNKPNNTMVQQQIQQNKNAPSTQIHKPLLKQS